MVPYQAPPGSAVEKATTPAPGSRRERALAAGPMTTHADPERATLQKRQVMSTVSRLSMTLFSSSVRGIS